MEIKKDGTVSRLLRDVPLPRMFHAAQKFPDAHIEREDIEKAIFTEIARSGVGERVRPGMRIAVTAGSRGIRNVDEITRSVVAWVKSRGALPFIVPAMGSHGGATAEGQKELLAGYGITEQTMGCEIRSSMETVLLGRSELDKPVYMDRNAFEADGIILSCRLKPHNAFRGPIESGPCKMMTVGLGKQKGAEQVHSDGMDIIFKNIPTMAKVTLNTGKILFAIPCLENAYDQTLLFEAIPAEKILTREPELLKTAFANMPSLLVREGDVLVVDRIGKNFSGTGVDPNITGTFSTPYASGGVKVQRTCFLDLTEESHGNSLGVGLASAITRRIYDQIDADAMYTNCITSTVIKSAMVPCVLYTDKEAVQFCIRTCNRIDPERPRVIRIRNSLHIGQVMLSEAYYADVRAGKYPGLEALDAPEGMLFDDQGTLTTPWLS
ncbi:MAG: lactate racemase domain-containing protein [Candidatus Limiplasma sp.]|nr:lactate racemase domain-containing protein [Candidatus Limiplasma sp.]